MFRQDFTCPALLKDNECFYVYGAFTATAGFHSVPLYSSLPLALVAFARHYLRSSRLMSLSCRYLDVFSSLRSLPTPYVLFR